MKEVLKVWIRSERQIEEAIINGEETQVVGSDFGANEFVTFLRDDDLDFVRHVEYYLRGVEPTFKERWITVTKEERKKKKIRLSGINRLSLRRYSEEGKEKDLGKVNCVIVYDEHNGRMKRRIYITALDAKADPFRIYKLYKDRWTIENQGIRYLS